MTYSTVGDLLLGDMPAPSNASSYVQDASDEIDSKLGMRYQTPIVVDDSPANRMTNLLLKRINNWLASGRLILAQAITGEMQYMHSYGRQLVKDAEAALDQVVSGDIVLPGAEFLNVGDVGVSGPIISNLDAQSNVESFYSFVQQNPLTYVPPGQVIWPAGATRWPYTL